MIKSFIKENSPQWEKSKEQKMQEKIILAERAERLRRANKQKNELEKRLIQRKILETIKLLPRSAQEEIEKKERDEEKEKRKELQEVKENLWKKWRSSKKLTKKEKADTEKDTGDNKTVAKECTGRN